MKENFDKEMLFSKYHQNGTDSLSDSEIIQLILSYTSVKNTSDVSDILINGFGSANSVFNADINYLMRNNLDERSASLIKLVPAVSMNCILNKGQNFFIGNSDNMRCYFRGLYAGVSDERFYLISVNSHKMVKGEHLISVGSSESVTINKEKIIRHALSLNEYGFYMSHNHPIAEANPSDADYELTGMVVEIMKGYGVRIFDHVIVGMSSVVSMKELNCGIKFD